MMRKTFGKTVRNAWYQHQQREQSEFGSKGAQRWLSSGRVLVPVKITRLNDKGDGIGLGVVDHNPPMEITIPFAIPEEKLEVHLWSRDVADFARFQRQITTTNVTTKNHRKPHTVIFGQKVAEIAASPNQVPVKCTKFFKTCGGCKLQHLHYQEQLRQKQQQLEALFSHVQQPLSATYTPLTFRPILGVSADELPFSKNQSIHTKDNSSLYHYRNKVEFTCSKSPRWMLETDKENQEEQNVRDDFTMGFFPVSSVAVQRERTRGHRSRKKQKTWHARLVAIDDCALQHPFANRVLKELQRLLATSSILAFDFKDRSGFLKSVMFRTGTSPTQQQHAAEKTAEQQVDLMLTFVTTSWEDSQSAELERLVQQLLANLQHSGGSDDSHQVVSILQRLDDDAYRRLTKKQQLESETESDLEASGLIQQQERVLFGRSFLYDSILNERFQVTSTSFFQPNSSQAGVLYTEIIKAIQHGVQSQNSARQKPLVVWDLFCGVGSIGICVAKAMDQLDTKVYGIEVVPSAVEMARANALLNGLTTETTAFHCLDLTQHWDLDLDFELPDVVIVDPPRAGLHKKLIKLLKRIDAPVLCYVSCNPASQVADLQALILTDEKAENETPYQVQYIQPVDMLPHTPHLETIALLTKSKPLLRK